MLMRITQFIPVNVQTDRTILKCSGGCLAFKIDEILNIQNYAEKRAERLG